MFILDNFIQRQDSDPPMIMLETMKKTTFKQDL